MTTYHIATDSGQYDPIEASSVAEALAATDVPDYVRSAEAFEGWLAECGGYGYIREDGIQVAECS